MSFRNNTCGKCFNTYEFYPQHNIVPPCPHCGYPEVKDSGDDWARSMGVNPTPAKESHESQ